MAITQTEFNQYADIGYNGQLNTDYNWDAASPIAEGDYILFGRAVVYGTGDNQATLPGAGFTADQVIGVTLRTHAVAANLTPDTDGYSASGYAEGRPMSVLQKGRMYVTAVDGSVRGDQVYIASDGTLTSTAEGNVELTGARFVRTAAAGEISEIYIR